MANKTPGVRRRCRADCPPKCDRHTWEFHVELPQDEQGKRRQVTEGGFRTMADAKEARAEVLRRHKAGTLPDREQRKRTTRAYLEEWHATKLGSGALRPSTARCYRGHLDRYLLPHLGQPAARGPARGARERDAPGHP